jgi:hypothetical protein
MKEGSVDVEGFAAYVDDAYAEHGGAARALKEIDAIHQMVDPHPDLAAIALSVDDVRRLAREGRRAIIIGVEGGHAIEDSLAVLATFQRLGARYMTLTHFVTNHWADSSMDAPKHHGLTKFGEEVVRSMNRLGMLVDVSHVSDETFYAVARISKAPLFASHSSARALCDVPRNMTDDMLATVGKSKGVVMTNYIRPKASFALALASALTFFSGSGAASRPDAVEIASSRCRSKLASVTVLLGTNRRIHTRLYRSWKACRSRSMSHQPMTAIPGKAIRPSCPLCATKYAVSWSTPTSTTKPPIATSPTTCHRMRSRFARSPQVRQNGAGSVSRIRPCLSSSS